MKQIIIQDIMRRQLQNSSLRKIVRHWWRILYVQIIMTLNDSVNSLENIKN